jgi:hypothetical protein
LQLYFVMMSAGLTRQVPLSAIPMASCLPRLTLHITTPQRHRIGIGFASASVPRQPRHRPDICGGGQEGIQCGWALGKQNSLRSHLTSPGLRDGPRGKARSIDRGCPERLSLWTQLIQASCPSRVRRDHTVFIKILPHYLQALLLGSCVCDPGRVNRRIR